MKAITLIAVLGVGTLFATEASSVAARSGGVAISKPYFLEIRFAESATALKEPSDSFIQAARGLRIAVTESDSGEVSSSEASVTYKIKKSGSTFPAELRVTVANRTVNTRIALPEDRWTPVSEGSRGGSSTEFFYLFARVSKKG